MAKKTDYGALAEPELLNRLNDAREELMNLRFQQASGELTDFNRISVTRREVARLLTMIQQRQQSAKKEG